jgi:2'-hydroxyisoflavone reductase
MLASGMNVLVLGGTRFLGRHIVERLAERGHRVVCFHRGQTAWAFPDGVEERLGDRNVDLSAVGGESWDAVIDTSGYRAEQLRRSLELRSDRYLFISTVNVSRDLSVTSVTEDAPTVEEFDPSDEAAAYGGNKAACERLVKERHPERGTIFRPGLIAGRWDPTGRFTYWCDRLLRGGRVLAPNPPSRLVEFIDAADIACFAAHALSNNIAGVFNLVGPAVPTTMERFLQECAEVATTRGAQSSTIVWADGDFLLEHGVQQWSEIPLWLTEPEYAGVLEISNTKALAAGLQLRPIGDTVRAVLDWASESPSQGSAMSSEREAELLAKLGGT